MCQKQNLNCHCQLKPESQWDSEAATGGSATMPAPGRRAPRAWHSGSGCQCGCGTQAASASAPVPVALAVARTPSQVAGTATQAQAASVALSLRLPVPVPASGTASGIASGTQAVSGSGPHTEST